MFEAKSIRKYCITRGARVALFGKSKELIFVNDIERELSELSLRLQCPSSKTDDSTFPPYGNSPSFSSSAMVNNVLSFSSKKREHRVVPEPVSGAYVAAMLDEFVRHSIGLQPEWGDDPHFYEINEKQTDERLFTLLLGDAVSHFCPIISDHVIIFCHVFMLF